MYPHANTLVSCPAGVGGLRDVVVTVPMAVAPGDTVTLRCAYDLEGDPLYTVKWYKSRQEFFRYVPKELPHTRVFPLPGVNVDVSRYTSLFALSRRKCFTVSATVTQPRL